MWHLADDTRLIEPQDTIFWNQVWQSDAGHRIFHDPAYAAVRARVLAQPWWFVTPRQAYEARHFSVWFAQTLLVRTYRNPVLADLYLLHDLLHAVTFVDGPDQSEAQWRARMRANEIAVSLETEVLLYARFPWLRALTFEAPIWADRFDLTPTGQRQPLDWRGQAWLAEQARWGASSGDEARLRRQVPARSDWPLAFPSSAAFAHPDTLWAVRRGVTLAPRAGDAVEQTLARYEADAVGFYDSWADQWSTVERERQRFASLVAAGRWGEACAEREALWTTVSDAAGVPYGAIARLTA